MMRLASLRRAALAIGVLAIAAFGTVQAQAQSPEEFFKGKTVRIVVGYGPGGGYDIYARMIAPYIAKALGASVIVENQPGAGGITALLKGALNLLPQLLSCCPSSPPQHSPLFPCRSRRGEGCWQSGGGGAGDPPQREAAPAGANPRGCRRLRLLAGQAAEV